MAHRTPLRLIDIDVEEGPPAPEDVAAVPVETFDDNDAATRKVAASGMTASGDVLRSRWRRLLTWQMLVSAGGAVLLSVLAVILATRAPTTVGVAPASKGIATATIPRQDGLPRPHAHLPVLEPATADAPKGAPVVETIHISVRATPVEAELSLDGKVVAGHRLNLDVPKDGRAHFVSAWASGYVPFNRQVTFSGDVALDITLRRDHASSVPHPATRGRPLAVVPAVKRVVPTVKPAVTPTSMPAPAQAPAQPRVNVEPGMNLDRPSARTNAKSPIDERNPYRP